MVEEIKNLLILAVAVIYIIAGTLIAGFFDKESLESFHSAGLMLVWPLVLMAVVIKFAVDHAYGAGKRIRTWVDEKFTGEMGDEK